MNYVKTIIFFVLSILLIACTDKKHVSDQEQIRSDEQQQQKIATQNFEKLIEKYKTSHVARGAHAKAHACVKAYFKINNDIEPELRQGLFSETGKQYKAWIRLSNGHFDLSNTDDNKDDARGFALKVLEPTGIPLQVAANNIPTQDFLLTNSTVFFASDIKDYNELVAAPDQFLKFFFPSWNPFDWRLKELKLAKQTLTPPPESLLWPDYFSITPYKLGELNVKYKVQSCSAKNNIEINADQSEPDFLRQRLKHELRTKEACFEFMIQKQDVSKNMPIEDPTIEWKEEDSPFISVAKITVPKQEFDSKQQKQFCENLSFSPWHALEAHRPIGQFNRLRRVVYPASSNYRHAKNQEAIPESIQW